MREWFRNSSPGFCNSSSGFCNSSPGSHIVSSGGGHILPTVSSGGHISISSGGCLWSLQHCQPGVDRVQAKIDFSQAAIVMMCILFQASKYVIMMQCNLGL
jgi:hypothetical protein